ncbi:hypothetical protein ABGB17_20290 [Sphaerisporangium sp. B11E5]|uniref:hypothetical protein n=1 Tax=Sphaerisporangium sp. B11E5 TaxID=3153563 RepID=UPI00325E3DC9
MSKLISGHAPGDLRNPFLEAIEEHGLAAARDMRRPGFTKLWNCTDILPGWACDLLDVPSGSTYAQAVRSLPA